MSTNAKIFKTKIGSGFFISVPLLLCGILALCFYTRFYIPLIIALPVMLLATYTVLSIEYKITEDKLIISSGPFYKLQILISSIHKIEETWGIRKSPAGSTDRLEIFYNTDDSVMISPKDKTGFIKTVQEINPQIEIKMKK